MIIVRHNYRAGYTVNIITMIVNVIIINGHYINYMIRTAARLVKFIRG